MNGSSGKPPIALDYMTEFDALFQKDHSFKSQNTTSNTNPGKINLTIPKSDDEFEDIILINRYK